MAHATTSELGPHEAVNTDVVFKDQWTGLIKTQLVNTPEQERRLPIKFNPGHWISPRVIAMLGQGQDEQATQSAAETSAHTLTGPHP